MKTPVMDNPWQVLRSYTAARIAPGRSGISLPTAAQLEFQLAHARARDAVHHSLDAHALATALQQEPGAGGTGLPAIVLKSAAASREIYLQRPDLGRKLCPDSRAELEREAPEHDIALVVADGLSAIAIERNARAFLCTLLDRLKPEGWSVAPLVIVQQGRVAIGDEIGELLHARTVVVLIGERPGLSSPDSMGIYLTWAPRVGLTDESRNCISNVREAGLHHEEAAYRLHYLLSEARRRKYSGVALKDETQGMAAHCVGTGTNFLLG